MLLLLCLTLLTAAQGSASKVSGSGSTEVQFGGEAHFECTVDPAKGVRQVTWQRSFKDESIENLATFSSRFGQEVNAAYQGKVEFTRAALNSTSIRLRSVSWEDESCYICLFNMYPDGSKRKHTCLTVTGVSSVNTSTALLQKEEEELHAFSCSATGKPAPSIHWELPPDAAVDNQTETTTSRNSDGTFTSSRSVTLRAPPVWSGMVDCVLNQGTSGERRRRIRSGNLEEITKESSGSVSRSHLVVIATASCLALCLGAVAAAAALRCKRSKMATPMAEEV
ncbi:OX-2 membrane glycoprotein isoform X2 [Oryzias melastigma]|uniref:OX-2 membrane glycoprotein isoform X2 n=1 Tax=Oryzias melastigma TaxID=30732 RepID=UPI000CF8158E|nr:OX-2 membrane glycoprotein isoform X2 [Oryzias melastigma]